MDLEKLCGEVCGLARATGQYLKSQAGGLSQEDILSKGYNDFVTYVDKTSEKQLVEALSALLPEAGFLVEENTVSNWKDAYNWVVDPLDGTSNFIHGIPLYCVSIALMEGERAILGVIYEPNLDECFYGWEGGTACLNGKVIQVSEVAKFSDSMLATGFPYSDYRYLDRYLDLLKFTMQNTHGLRRLGSAAVDLAWVACGRFDGFYEYSLKPWDVAAGSLLVTLAGGQVGDFSGNANYIFGQEIIASNALIYKEFMDIVNTFILA